MAPSCMISLTKIIEAKTTLRSFVDSKRKKLDLIDKPVLLSFATSENEFNASYKAVWPQNRIWCESIGSRCESIGSWFESQPWQEEGAGSETDNHEQPTHRLT